MKKITTQHNGLEIMGMKINNLTEAIAVADYFAQSDLVPRDYRNKSGNIVVAWQKGYEVGLMPQQSLETIAVINGRACIWGDGLLALVKNSNKEEWTHETITGNGDSMVATCETKRRGQEQTIVRSFSVEDATKAGLWGNNVWKKYPKRMLQMRARGLCLRDAYPDVLNGMALAEEQVDIQYNQKTEAKQAPKTLAQLGLTTVEKDGFLVVEGNTYGKTEFLKQMGFQLSNKKWCKELPKGEEIIDIQIEDEVDEKPKPSPDSPAKLLMKVLKTKGIQKERIGEFVQNFLGLSSKDTEGINKVLSNVEALDEMVKNFLAEPEINLF